MQLNLEQELKSQFILFPELYLSLITRTSQGQINNADINIHYLFELPLYVRYLSNIPASCFPYNNHFLMWVGLRESERPKATLSAFMPKGGLEFMVSSTSAVSPIWLSSMLEGIRLGLRW